MGIIGIYGMDIACRFYANILNDWLKVIAENVLIEEKNGCSKITVNRRQSNYKEISEWFHVKF